MKMRIFLMLACFSQANSAFAKLIYYGSEIEALTLVNGTSTILRFDEDVKTISQASKFIIEPSDPADPNYRVLTIKPRFLDSTDTITFILVNEATIRLKVQTVAVAIPEKTDNFYDLKPKEQKIDPEESKGTDVTELELMKAMIRSDNPVGYNAQEYLREIHTGVDHIVAHLVKIYTGPRFNGYVFKLENSSCDMSYAVDLKSLTLGSPNQALLSQVDEKILKPKGEKRSVTFLRIVAKPSSIYHSVALPIEPILVK